MYTYHDTTVQVMLFFFGVISALGVIYVCEFGYAENRFSIAKLRVLCTTIILRFSGACGQTPVIPWDVLYTIQGTAGTDGCAITWFIVCFVCDFCLILCLLYKY